MSHLDRINNFDFLRVVFALLVIISHSFPLYGFSINDDWLYKATHIIRFSDLGLGGFFCISGYLVYQSAERSSNYGSFIWKRVLRIFPGLIVNALLVALVLGAVVVGTLAYYKDPTVYTYILRNITLYNIQYTINGVFSSNPAGPLINGSLWTITYEFLFYLLFFVFFLGKKISRVVRWLMAPLFCLLIFTRLRYPEMGFTLPGTSIVAKMLNHFSLWFLAGTLLAISSKYWQRHRVLIAVISGGLLLTMFTKQLPFFVLFALWPVFVLSFATCKTPIISRLDKLGDPSYGIYIYSYVIQQSLVYFFDLSFGSFMAASIVLSIIFGYASWYLIEKKALRLKKRRTAPKPVSLEKVPA